MASQELWRAEDKTLEKLFLQKFEERFFLVWQGSRKESYYTFNGDAKQTVVFVKKILLNLLLLVSEDEAFEILEDMLESLSYLKNQAKKGENHDT